MTNITPRAHGADISKYDIYFKPELITGQLDFVVQRISYGTTRDQAFLTLLPGVMQMPIRGGYHYLSSQLDWKTQADTFLSFVAGFDYHFYNCDFEGAYNLLSMDFVKAAYQWIDYVEQKSGKPVLLYTSLDLYNRYMFPSQTALGLNWNKVKLWQAQWLFVPNPNGTPSNPTGRTAGWTLFQYTNQGNADQYGCAPRGEFDLDVYNGTPQEMAQWLGASEVTPPDNGGTMTDYKVVAAVSFRSQPSTQVNGQYSAANVLGTLQVGDVVTGSMIIGVSDPVTQWIHFSNIKRVNGTVETRDAYCSGYPTYVVAIAAPPPPATGKAVTVDINIDGYNPLTLSGTLTLK